MGGTFGPKLWRLFAAPDHSADVRNPSGEMKSPQRSQGGNESDTRRQSPVHVDRVKVYCHADSADPIVTPGAGNVVWPVKYSSMALAAPRPSLMAHTTSD